MASVAGWARAAALGVAAWLGTGALALVAEPRSPELARAGGLLPVFTVPILIVLAWFGLRLAGARRLGVGVALVIAAVLPWLPGPARPALAAWAGPIVWILGAAVVAVGWWAHASTPRWPPHRHAATAAAIVLAGALGAAWNLSPILPGGDEPHYLVITQSLLNDGDLAIDDNHARRDYAAYFGGTLRPDFLKRGVDGRIYSIHAPGVAAFVLPAFALGGYPAVVAWLAAFSALGSWWLWTTAWRLTGTTSAAWFGWSVAALSTPAFFQSFSVFPDGPAAVFVVAVVALLVRAPSSVWPWLGGGVALAALPWFHTRYAVIAVALAVPVVIAAWRSARLRGLAAFAAVPLIGAAGWFLHFYAIYGTPDPRAPYGTYTQTALRYVPRGLSGLLIDQQFGLLFYAPALAIALAGLACMAGRAARATKATEATEAAEATMAAPGASVPPRFVGLAIAGALVPYALLSAAYAMWWGGASSPARFLAPVTLVLGVPAAFWWAACRRTSSRMMGILLAAVTVATTVVLAGAEDGRLAYNIRDGYALWLAWAAPAVDLASAFPSLHRQTVGGAWSLAALWGAALAVVWMLARMLERRVTASRAAAITLVAGVLVVPVALPVAWRIAESDGVAAAQGQHRLVQRLAARGVQAAWLDATTGRPHFLDRDAVASRLAIGPLTRPAARPGELLVWPELPAGVYDLEVPDGVPAWRLGVGRDEGEIAASAGGGTYRVAVPVSVHSLRLRADLVQGSALEGVRLRPRSLERRADAIPGRAVSAARFGGHAVFFLDEGAFVEPDAWWVRAERAAGVVIVPAEPRRAVRLDLQNGAVENEVTVESGTWRDVRRMAPGARAEISLAVPGGSTGLPLNVRSAGGFVPAATDPASDDRRALGVRCTLR